MVHDKKKKKKGPTLQICKTRKMVLLEQVNPQLKFYQGRITIFCYFSSKSCHGNKPTAFKSGKRTLLGYVTKRSMIKKKLAKICKANMN